MRIQWIARWPRWRTLAVAALATVAVAAAACTPETNVTVAPSSGPVGIAVSGTGTASVKPDIAKLSLGVSVVAPIVAEARDRAAASLLAMQNAVKAKGVAEKDVQTVAFNIHPQYRFTEAKGQEIIGYRVTNILLVTVRKIDQVADVLDSAVKAGGNDVRVNSLTFAVENPEQYLKDARAKALAQAKERADILAAAAGVKLGAPLSIVESSGGVPPPLPAAMEARGVGGETPISPGEQELRVNVSVTYSIQ
ncbi:MAG: DUF541 domain-containing protein [Chloroflexi bacterium]|nr:DUF541 domain-containing protein [Chloroflexota bacterium]